MTFAFNDWSMINHALSRFAQDLHDSEMKRTGGAGFASGGKLGAYEDCNRIKEQVSQNLRDTLI